VAGPIKDCQQTHHDPMLDSLTACQAPQATSTGRPGASRHALIAKGICTVPANHRGSYHPDHHDLTPLCVYLHYILLHPPKAVEQVHRGAVGMRGAFVQWVVGIFGWLSMLTRDLLCRCSPSWSETSRVRVRGEAQSPLKNLVNRRCGTLLSTEPRRAIM
jgi:hypothetical protein